MPQHTTSLSYQNIVGQSQDPKLPLSVHDLPPEIVGIIFTMLQETWLGPSDKGIPPVLAVSRTCRQWRQISLSLPSLWSHIAIQLMELDPSDYHHITLLTRLFADRSQKHPLRLILHFDEVASLDGREDTVIPILSTLVQHSERWHTVEFHSIARAVMLHQVFSPISGRLPMLVDLTLFLEAEEEDMSLDISCDLFSNCPSLTYLSLTPGYSPNHHQWLQIRVLDLYYMEISDALRFAMSSTNMEQLSLHYCDGESSSPFPLSSITQLTIAATEADEVYGPLESLMLPRLSSLDISRGPGFEGEDWEDWDENVIQNFLQRSGCTVTSLSLRGVPISDEQLIKLLRSMPALSSLRIEEFFDDLVVIPNQTLTRRFLQELTIDDTSSPLLPKLTDIVLVLREDGLADTVLPNALISRWVPDGSQSEVACIKTVNVAFVDESKKTVKDLALKLQYLNKRGALANVQRVQVATADADSEDAEYEAS